MEYINGWYIKDNNVSRSLLRFHVGIEIKSNDEGVFYQLVVSSNNKTILIFNFYSFEDAVSFTNNVICNYTTKEEIVEEYRNLYEHGAFKTLKKGK